MIVMVRAIQAIGLLDQGAVGRDLGFGGFQLRGPVRRHGQAHMRGRIKINMREMLSGQHGRIHQCLQRHGLETPALARLQRRSDLPAGGQFQFGGDGNAAREITRRVQHHRVPLQVQHHVGGNHPAFL